MNSNEGGTTKTPSRAPIVVLTVSSLVLGLAVVWAVWQARRVGEGRVANSQRRAIALPSTRWKNAQPGVKYVGDLACARCHAEIADTFRRHPMGRSLAPISPLKAVGGDRSNDTTTFEAGSSRYSIERRDGREVHREVRLDVDGRILAQVEAEVKYALGSGTRGISYLIEHDGRLLQSPISWYGQRKLWDHSPGYDVNDFHFDRQIEPSCLFCHANRVLPVDHSVNRYEQPIFRGDAIGCERCHGPGELHARRQEVVEGRDLTIVNPRHLEPALRDAVCEQCHLLGDHRVDRLGRQTFDYRPGLPLIEFFAVYGRAEERGNTAVGQGRANETQSVLPPEPGPPWLHLVPRSPRGPRTARKDGLFSRAVPGLPQSKRMCASRSSAPGGEPGRQLHSMPHDKIQKCRYCACRDDGPPDPEDADRGRSDDRSRIGPVSGRSARSSMNGEAS